MQAYVAGYNPKRNYSNQSIIDPLQDSVSSVELVRVSGSDLDIVNAARVSYGKVVEEFSAKDQKLIEFLVKHDHTSPFEHNQLSFRVKAPIFVARQWMRHRMNSYNEMSYRYTQAPLEFYVPATWRSQDTANHQASIGAFENSEAREAYIHAIETSVRSYSVLLSSGVARELARCVLPVCTYTEFIFTCNLHSLVHFLRLRMHAGAQYEIRQYADAMLTLALPHFPCSLKLWAEKFGFELPASQP